MQKPRLLLAMIATTAVTLPLLSACDSDRKTVELPRFEDAALQQGRSIWMQVCRNCHLAGIAGAPRVDDASAWRQRAAQGRQALYTSAISGIPGTDGDWKMPPRGGNDSLTDESVRRAVDYMLAVAIPKD